MQIILNFLFKKKKSQNRLVSFWKFLIFTISSYMYQYASRNAHPLYPTKVQPWTYFQLWKHASLNSIPRFSEKLNKAEATMSGALFRNAAAQLIRRNAAASDPFVKTGTRLQSRPYLRSNQPLGRPKQTRIPPPPSSGFCSSSSSSAGLVGWYLGMVKSRPVLTKGITSSLIYIAADLSSQVLTFFQNQGSLLYICFHLIFFQQTITKEKASSESYDLVRTARMGAYGLLILGPVQHQWFGFMSRLFPKQDFITSFKKVAMGQTVYGPTIMVIFLSFNALLQGKKLLVIKVV